MCTVRRSHIGGWCECIDWSNIELYSTAIVERSCKYIQGFYGEHIHDALSAYLCAYWSTHFMPPVCHCGIPYRQTFRCTRRTTVNCELWCAYNSASLIHGWSGFDYIICHLAFVLALSINATLPSVTTHTGTRVCTHQRQQWDIRDLTFAERNLHE